MKTTYCTQIESNTRKKTFRKQKNIEEMEYYGGEKKVLRWKKKISTRN